MFRNISDSIVNIRGVHIAFKILSRTKSEVKLLNPSATWYPEIGICLDEKPIILKLRKGSDIPGVHAPWCDGSHSAEGVTTLRPLHFEVEKDGEYSVCGCKATKNRPLCDGSHVKVKKRRYTDPPQYCAYAESPVYEGVANKLGYKPKEG
ncbi:CDGSH Iron Sulfur Domain protein, partial [Dirofilaria immitis]|nr:CDGSH Iron Sulfur Domain protein [Dirofilaria immitis]